jgi:hypothetical protein
MGFAGFLQVDSGSRTASKSCNLNMDRAPFVSPIRSILANTHGHCSHFHFGRSSSNVEPTFSRSGSWTILWSMEICTAATSRRSGGFSEGSRCSGSAHSKRRCEIGLMVYEVTMRFPRPRFCVVQFTRRYVPRWSILWVDTTWSNNQAYRGELCKTFAFECVGRWYEDKTHDYHPHTALPAWPTRHAIPKCLFLQTRCDSILQKLDFIRHPTQRPMIWPILPLTFPTLYTQKSSESIHPPQNKE